MWGGGVTSFREICRSGQLKNTPKNGSIFWSTFCHRKASFLCFPCVFRAFSSTLPIMSDLFVCGSRGPKSVPVLHHFTLLPASPAQGVTGMQGMQGMSLVSVVFVQEKYSHFLGVFLEAGFVSARLVVAFGGLPRCRRCRGCRGCRLFRKFLCGSAFGGLPRDSKGKNKARESKGKQRKTKESKGRQGTAKESTSCCMSLAFCESTAACDDILIAARAVSTSCTVEFVNARSSYFSTLGDVCFLSPAGGSRNARDRERERERQTEREREREILFSSDGKRFLKRWELVCEVVGGVWGGG